MRKRVSLIAHTVVRAMQEKIDDLISMIVEGKQPLVHTFFLRLQCPETIRLTSGPQRFHPNALWRT